jgi:hypothetical protein
VKANEVNLFVSSVLFVFWYHSPNFLDTPLIIKMIKLRRGNWSGQLHAGNLHIGCFMKINYRP